MYERNKKAEKIEVKYLMMTSHALPSSDFLKRRCKKHRVKENIKLNRYREMRFV